MCGGDDDDDDVVLVGSSSVFLVDRLLSADRKSVV